MVSGHFRDKCLAPDRQLVNPVPTSGGYGGKRHMRDAIKGVLFDKDGTLFDFQATWAAWAETVFTRAAGGDAALMADISRVMGYDPLRRRFKKDSIVIAHTAHEVALALAGVLRDRTVDEVLVEVNRAAAEVPQVAAVPLRPLLGTLHARGLKLGLATNDAEAPARAHLAAAGIGNLFDFIAGFDSGFGGKPQTGMSLGFCAKVGLRPDQVLMVGDSVHDLMAGRDAGMGTVGVLTGVAEGADLMPHADVVLKDIGDLPALLAGFAP